MSLKPASNDPNRRSELARKKKDPESFGTPIMEGVMPEGFSRNKRLAETDESKDVNAKIEKIEELTRDLGLANIDLTDQNELITDTEEDIESATKVDEEKSTKETKKKLASLKDEWQLAAKDRVKLVEAVAAIEAELKVLQEV